MCKLLNIVIQSHNENKTYDYLSTRSLFSGGESIIVTKL